MLTVGYAVCALFGWLPFSWIILAVLFMLESASDKKPVETEEDEIY